MPVTWNPNDKGPNITLSGSNLTATSSATFYDQIVRATDGKLTGKWVFSAVMNTADFTEGIGVCNFAQDLTDDFLPLANGILALRDNNTWRYNGTTPGATSQFWASGTEIMIAVDAGARLIWMSSDGGTTWYGSTSAGNPAAGTNGQAVGFTGEIFPCITTSDGRAWVGRFTSGSIVGTIPSGFSAWDPGALTLPAFPAGSTVFNDADMLATNWSDPTNGLRMEGFTDPRGTNKSLRIYSDVAGGIQMGFRSSVRNDTTVYTAVEHRFRVKAKSGGAQFIRFATYDGTNDWGVIFDLQNGTVGSSRAGGGTELTPSITSLGNGWYTCEFGVTADGTAWTDYQVGPTNTNSTDFDANSTLPVGEGVYVFEFEGFIPTLDEPEVFDLSSDVVARMLADARDWGRLYSYLSYALPNIHAGTETPQAVGDVAQAYLGAVWQHFALRWHAGFEPIEVGGQEAPLNNYTLTADVGTFTLTGVAANLLAGRKVVASAGSFAMTGIAANLVSGRRVTASPGTFTLTGRDATLVYGTVGSYTLVANAGAFTLTGNAATLRRGAVVRAEAGSFSLAGNAANLVYGSLAPPDTGPELSFGGGGAAPSRKRLQAVLDEFRAEKRAEREKRLAERIAKRPPVIKKPPQAVTGPEHTSDDDDEEALEWILNSTL